MIIKGWHGEVLCGDGIVLNLDCIGGYRNLYI